MSYDHWKTTNPADEFLGPEPDEDDGMTDPSVEEIVADMEANSARFLEWPRFASLIASWRERGEAAAKLRKALRDCAEALGNGAFVGEQCSDEFHCWVSKEVAILVDKLRPSAASARGWHDAVEAICTIVGVASGLGAEEAVSAVRDRFDAIRAVARKQALEEAEAEARRYVHEPDKQTNQFYEGMTYAKETIVARISALAAKGQP